jgi:hypothetical protein
MRYAGGRENPRTTAAMACANSSSGAAAPGQPHHETPMAADPAC